MADNPTSFDLEEVLDESALFPALVGPPAGNTERHGVGGSGSTALETLSSLRFTPVAPRETALLRTRALRPLGPQTLLRYGCDLKRLDPVGRQRSSGGLFAEGFRGSAGLEDGTR